MLTGALIGPVFAPTQDETPALRLVWLPVYAIVAGLLLARARQVVHAWPAWIALGVMVALAYASKYWSIDPEVTGRRVIAMAITGAFALYLGATFRGQNLPRVLVQAGFLMAVGSLVMVFAFPAIGVHHDVNAGLWRGLWYEKNQMGIVMTATAVAAAACLASGDRRILIPLVALALSCLLVLATQSKTSLLCLMLGLGVVGGLWTMRAGGPAFSVLAVWLAVVGSCLFAILWFSHSAAILEALGKDPSLTGRTDIWDALMQRVADRPWTGYGYNAFWGRESVPAAYIRLETGWSVPSAHNGWIDLLVQLGWPGLILVAALFAMTAVTHLCRAGGLGAREGGFSLAYLAVFLMLSFSESILLSHQNLPWTLFLAILARAVATSAVDIPTPLARRQQRAYQTPPRIVPDYSHGRLPFPVR